MATEPGTERTLHGELVLAQEHRLLLVDRSGRHWPVSVGPAVPWGPDELTELARDACIVEVKVAASRNSRSYVASQLRVLAERKTR